MSKTGTGARHLPPTQGRAQLATEKPQQYTQRQVWDLEVRKMKRAAKAIGIVDETPNYWSYIVDIDGVSHTGRVIATSRSEARAATKKALGLKKFPRGADINLTNQGQQPKPDGSFIG